MTPKRNRYLPLFIILGVYFLFARAYLLRPLWFDESLTVLNFALAPRLTDIYFNYAIPNNQICYTILLRLWLEIQPPIIDTTVWLRLLSVLLGAGTLSAIYCLFRTRCGNRWILLPTVIALGISVPFLIYATALRGYMLSALLVTLTVHFALNFARSRNFKSWIYYAVSSILTIGTIPTNLIILAGAVLYALPLFQTRFYLKKSFWVMALTPPVMLTIFYLPIAQQFINCLNLGEGWHSGSKVIIMLVAALVYSFIILLIPATGALLINSQRKNKYLKIGARALIWLLPIPAALLLKVAPFPRVFYPFWPLWALLIAGGIRDLTALYCRKKRRWHPTIWIAALTIAVIWWGWQAQSPKLREAFSKNICGNELDDYFWGYYLQETHCPEETVKKLKELYPNGAPLIYLTFSADPWAVMFYGNLNNLTSPNNYLFDGPRGRVNALPPGSLVIMHQKESPLALEERFQIKLKKLFQTPNHGVYFGQ